MNTVKEKAYAKLNIYLSSCGIRDDGFHSVESVMTAVSLADEVKVSFAPSRFLSIGICVKGAPYIPTDERNLACKAARTFCEYCGIVGRIQIELDKAIPVAAGLGGGSSDAAAVLRALNRIFKNKLSLSALLTMAGGIGSDVPFCIVGKTALCSGRGEIIEKRYSGSQGHFVVAIADEKISTPVAYRMLDEYYHNFDGTVHFSAPSVLKNILHSAEAGKCADCGYNVFEPVVFSQCEGAKKIADIMKENGAFFSQVSGSGPSVFGAFETQEVALKCEKMLKEKGYRAYACRSVS